MLTEQREQQIQRFLKGISIADFDYTELCYELLGEIKRLKEVNLESICKTFDNEPMVPLKRIIAMLQLNNKQVADACGIESSRFSRAVKGSTRLTANQLISLAAYLGIQPQDLQPMPLAVKKNAWRMNE